jgi:hypothetical protein
MAINIGDSQVRQMKRTKIDGPEEVLTESFDPAGNKISESYHIRTPGGDEVTLHDEEAMVSHPDGSISYFKSISGAFKFEERLIFSPTGELETVADKANEDLLNKDLGLIMSARLMFDQARVNREEFEEI